MGKLIRFDDAAREALSRGVEQLAAAVRVTLGPRGRNVVIDRGVIAVVAELRRQARGVDSHADISQVATVSARGDAQVGEMIAEAIARVGRHGVITVGEGPGLTTTLSVVEGTRFDGGYVSPYFVTDAELMESALDNAYVVIADQALTDAQQVIPALELAARAGRPLIVVAEDIEREALATLVVNRLRGTVASVAVRAPGSGSHRRELLEDLAVLTGAKLFAAESGSRIDRFTAADFGRVGRAQVDASTTLLVQCGGDGEGIRARLAWLRRESKRGSGGAERTWWEQRLACLAGAIAVIEVGAASDSERHERKSLVEDSLAATHSAVEEGVVTGGGVALLRSQRVLLDLKARGDEAAGIEVLRKALEEPALRIAENAGQDAPRIVAQMRAATGAVGFDAITATICDLERRGILDPVKVTRSALEHAASIGALVLTTDAIVVDAPDDQSEGPKAA